MDRVIQTGILLVAFMPGLCLLAGEPSCGNAPPCSFGQFTPFNGWNPGVGKLRWWQKCCFPNCGD
ncbi:MAG: hypothetical protein ACKVP0_05890 [Pirellulaceae bacterium]